MRALRIVPLALILPSLAQAERTETLRSYWNEDRTTIFSDVRVVHDDGTSEVRSVIGGSVDGIGMVQYALYRQPGGAFAFVPTRNTDAKRLHWEGSCILITPDSAGSNDIAAAGEMDALNASLQEWNDAVSSCSYMRFQLEPAEALEVGRDSKNALKFRETEWCRPARGDTAKKCYDSGATAITTLSYIDRAGRADDGAILDADIEVNSVDYALAVGCPQCITGSSNPDVEDLQNTLTHELGHVLGLDHTCWDGEADRAPLDDEGNPAPSCTASNLPASITESTMYPYQLQREIKKRSVEADDVDGVCTNYPLARDPGVCEAVPFTEDGGCCAVAGAGTRRGRDGAAALGGLLFAAFLVGRRARARACSRSRTR